MYSIIPNDIKITGIFNFHNPKVVGSNPAAATKLKSIRQRALIESETVFSLPDVLHSHFIASAELKPITFRYNGVNDCTEISAENLWK